MLTFEIIGQVLSPGFQESPEFIVFRDEKVSSHHYCNDTSTDSFWRTVQDQGH